MSQTEAPQLGASVTDAGLAWAVKTPDRPAIIMADSDRGLTYGQLGVRAGAIAALLRARGLGPGDVIVLFALNHPDFLSVCLGARAAGVDFTPASKFLRPEEIGYIIANSQARAVFASAALAPLLDGLACPALAHRFTIDGAAPGFEELERLLPRHAGPAAEQKMTPGPAPVRRGREMLYSSGTTGRPKGIRTLGPHDGPPAAVAALTGGSGFDENAVNLTPAALYHAAPLRFSIAVALSGGANVIMERFDAERMLAAIERRRVTHLQVVPTMLVRLLKLPDPVRRRYDVSSLRYLSHSAGPCPADVKRRIIDWFGPIVVEHYGGSEGNGLCTIGAEEWLAHPGSVGRAVVGRLHIVGDDGEELPVGEAGAIYFEGGPEFEYLGDPEKTAASRNARGWTTLGDIGRVDEDGFLYLADRRVDLIISGGVNIYPREIEAVLLAHPDVLDAGVVGAPDEEYGQQVAAFVEPRDPARDAAELARALDLHCRERLSRIQAPRRITVLPRLPRDDAGKLFKQRLRDRLDPA